MSEHTPAPWVARGRHVGVSNHMSLIAECRDQNGNWTNGPMGLANAAFIVKAVNNLEQMARALEVCACSSDPVAAKAANDALVALVGAQKET